MNEVVVIELSADGRGWIDGREVTLEAQDLPKARAVALQHVARIAENRGRSLRTEAKDPDGRTWHLMIHPSGRVEAADAGAARELAGDPEGRHLPTAYRHQATAVSTAAEDGDVVKALSIARALEDEVGQAYGRNHPYVWRVRELRAHAAYVNGLPAEACEEYMHIAHGWAHLDNDACRQAAQRAYACWHHISDSDRQAWLGEQLVAALRLAGDAAEPALRAVLRSVDELRSGIIL